MSRVSPSRWCSILLETNHAVKQASVGRLLTHLSEPEYDGSPENAVSRLGEGR
jgi:hypothetical protein